MIGGNHGVETFGLQREEQSRLFFFFFFKKKKKKKKEKKERKSAESMRSHFSFIRKGLVMLGGRCFKRRWI